MSTSLITFIKDIFKQKKYVIEDIRKYGFLNFLKKAYEMREAWWDKGDKVCVGKDQYGNTYWETRGPTEHVGRNRWVELKGKTNRIYDASEIPPEWHMWLHRIRDQPPTMDEIMGKGRMWRSKKWEPNPTGTVKRYYPPGHFFNPNHKNPINVLGTEPETGQETGVPLSK